jgi:alpha-methylacyl-CoA racemase
MVDGVALLTTVIHGMRSSGDWKAQPGTNVLDSGAHFYEVYETADGGHMAVGAIEPQFYAELLRILEIDPAQAPQWDRTRWPELKARFAAAFRARTRDEWAALFDGSDACVTPVLSLEEAPRHPHNVARGTFVDGGPGAHPAPAPRFSRTPAVSDRVPDDADEALVRWGISGAEIAELRDGEAVA